MKITKSNVKFIRKIIISKLSESPYWFNYILEKDNTFTFQLTLTINLTNKNNKDYKLTKLVTSKNLIGCKI